MRRLRKKITRKSDELSTRFPDLTPTSLLQTIAQSPVAATTLFEAHQTLAPWLDGLGRSGSSRPLLISNHPDRITDVSYGYGEGREKPEDYLERFNQWLQDNRSTHEALKLVLTAPGSLTNKDLRSLVLELSLIHI